MSDELYSQFGAAVRELVNQADLSEEEFGNRVDDLGSLRNEINEYPALIEFLKSEIKPACAGQPQRWNRAVGVLLPPASGLRF